MDKPGKRHRLLLYARQFSRLRAPTLLIAILSFILWWYAQLRPALSPELVQTAIALAAGLSALLFLYSLFAPGQAYIQCFPNYLRVNTPLFRMVISYSRIRTVRPVQFAPANLRGGERSFLQPFLGQTVIAIDLNGYPVGERMLRFFLNKHLFLAESTGLVFHTRDWMALSREIESYRSVWKTSRFESSRPDTPSINPFSMR